MVGWRPFGGVWSGRRSGGRRSAIGRAGGAEKEAESAAVVVAVVVLVLVVGAAAAEGDEARSKRACGGVPQGQVKGPSPWPGHYYPHF